VSLGMLAEHAVTGGLLPGMSDFAVVGFIGAARRLRCRAEWLELQGTREFARRRWEAGASPARDQDGRWLFRNSDAEHAADELVFELRDSRAQAEDRMELSLALRDRLPRMDGLQAAGLIDERYMDYARRRGVDPLIRNLGRLGRKQTIALQQTSHILLSFGWPGGLQVPCKVYEYFAARRPLLHIAGDAQDPAAVLVRKYRRGIVVQNDRRSIGEGLRSLYQLWTAGNLEEQFDLSPLGEFCLPRSLHGLEQAFDEVIPRERQTSALPVSNPVATEPQF